MAFTEKIRFFFATIISNRDCTADQNFITALWNHIKGQRALRYGRGVWVFEDRCSTPSVSFWPEHWYWNHFIYKLCQLQRLIVHQFLHNTCWWNMHCIKLKFYKVYIRFNLYIISIKLKDCFMLGIFHHNNKRWS